MPAIGVGCWFQKRMTALSPETYDMVSNALKAGYRHIDTAWGYGNEEAVGKAIRDSGVPREEIFVTTKLTNEYHDAVPQGFAESIKSLDIGYIDLYLVHWPQAVDKATGQSRPLGSSPTLTETWKEMEKLVGDKCRAIGVSNFSIKTLEVILKDAKIVPAANQVESHLYLPQTSLAKYCADKGIVMTAYSPLGQPAPGQPTSVILEEPLVKELAEKYNTKPGTILLSWIVNKPGWSAVPKSANPERLKANLQIVKLHQKDHDALTALHKEEGKLRPLVYPGNKMHQEGVFGWSIEDMGWDDLD